MSSFVAVFFSFSKCFVISAFEAAPPAVASAGAHSGAAEGGAARARAAHGGAPRCQAPAPRLAAWERGVRQAHECGSAAR